MVKKPPANAGSSKRLEFDPRVGKILWRRSQQATLVFLPGESHGQKSLAGYSPLGDREIQLKQLSRHICTLSNVK